MQTHSSSTWVRMSFFKHGEGLLELNVNLRTFEMVSHANAVIFLCQDKIQEKTRRGQKSAMGGISPHGADVGRKVTRLRVSPEQTYDQTASFNKSSFLSFRFVTAIVKDQKRYQSICPCHHPPATLVVTALPQPGSSKFSKSSQLG